MDLKLIKDALALIEERNLSRAATRRHVTQPAFSRRIRTLEQWLGVQLLERRSNRVILSPALVDNEAEFRAVLARVAQFRENLAHSHDKTRTFVVCTQHALGAGAVPAVLKYFGKQRPELNWQLRTLNRDDCIAVFFRGDADLLLCYEARGFPPLPFDDSIEKRLWMRDTLIPVIGGSLRHRLDASGELGANVPMVGYPESSHFGRLIAQTGADEPLRTDRVRSLILSDYSLGVLELIRAGVGLGWVPHSMCRAALSAGELLSLQSHYTSIPLDVTLFAARSNLDAVALITAEIAPQEMV